MHIYTHKTDGDITDIYKIEQNFDGDEEKTHVARLFKAEKNEINVSYLTEPTTGLKEYISHVVLTILPQVSTFIA